VARFSAAGAEVLRDYYHQLQTVHAGKIWKNGVVFEKAYLIHLYQAMLAAGEAFHMVATDGRYMEIDTEEDFALANALWSKK